MTGCLAPLLGLILAVTATQTLARDPVSIDSLVLTTQTLINIASMTKSVAAVGLLELVDEGRLSLDDHVSRYLPGFENAPASEITVRQLLLHTSGYMNFESFHGGLTPHPGRCIVTTT